MLKIQYYAMKKKRIFSGEKVTTTFLSGNKESRKIPLNLVEKGVFETCKGCGKPERNGG